MGSPDVELEREGKHLSKTKTRMSFGRSKRLSCMCAC